MSGFACIVKTQRRVSTVISLIYKTEITYSEITTQSAECKQLQQYNDTRSLKYQ